MYILKILIFLYFFIYSICVTFSSYPESITTIDQLTYDNLDRTLNVNEYFIVGLQPNSILNKIYFDKKLGIPFFPITLSKFTINSCPLSVYYYSNYEIGTGGGNDDGNWNNDGYYDLAKWVIENGNLDYLKCPDELNWETKTSCE